MEMGVSDQETATDLMGESLENFFTMFDGRGHGCVIPRVSYGH